MWKTVASDKTYIDYFQDESAVQTGLTNRFGIRVMVGACASVTETMDGQAFIFGKEYPLPVDLETLPSPVRMVIEDHMLNHPNSDLTDVLKGRKSFEEALTQPARGEMKRASARSGECLE